jgi:hypothetical protein
MTAPVIERRGSNAIKHSHSSVLLHQRLHEMQPDETSAASDQIQPLVTLHSDSHPPFLPLLQQAGWFAAPSSCRRALTQDGEYGCCSYMNREYQDRISPFLFSCIPQSAVFNFQSLLTVLLLLICVCTYVHTYAPSWLDNHKKGYMFLRTRSRRGRCV